MYTSFEEILQSFMDISIKSTEQDDFINSKQFRLYKVDKYGYKKLLNMTSTKEKKREEILVREMREGNQKDNSA